MKKIISLALILCLVFALAACGSTTTTTTPAAPAATTTEAPAANTEPAPVEGNSYSSGPLKVTFATSSPETAMSGVFYNAFFDKVTELSNGEITFDKYWSGSLLGHSELIEGLESGICDIALGVPDMQPTKTPLATMTKVFPFRSNDVRACVEAWREVYDAFPAMQEELAQYNVRMLAIQAVADWGIMSTEEVSKLSDLQGMKIAAAGATLPLNLAPTGCTPISMGGPDRYSALETGVIDGSVLDLPTHITEKVYENCSYYCEHVFGSTANLYLWANLEFYNGLTDEQKAIFDEAAAYCEDIYCTRVEEWLTEARQIMTDSGITITQLSDEDIATWCELVKDQPVEWASQNAGEDGVECLRLYYKALQDRGYEWPSDYNLGID